MEDAIEDRLSIRRFLGLGLIDSAIDETTFVAFCKCLYKAGVIGELFDTADAYLEKQGLMI